MFLLGPDGADHPDWNETDKSWQESAYGIQWGAQGKPFLPSHESLKDPNWTNPKGKPKKDSREGKGKKRERSFSQNKEKRSAAKTGTAAKKTNVSIIYRC